MVGLSERQKSGRIVDHFLYLAIENSARQKLAELLTAFLIRQNRVPIDFPIPSSVHLPDKGKKEPCQKFGPARSRY